MNLRPLFCKLIFPVLSMVCASNLASASDIQSPIVIAHRGASGYLPEHTLAAYSLAIWQGADYIEPDLVMTRDGVLIARHDNVLDLTTNVADHPEFADRKTLKVVDGREVEGWFSEDFTLEEIKTLRAIERIPETRPENSRFNGQFEIPTFEEIIQLAKALEPGVGRPIGLYPETKHPTYFQQLGLSMEEPLVELLHQYGYDKNSPVFIQSFEVENLKKLNELTNIQLIQLLWSDRAPYDQSLKPDGLSYADMATAQGLKDIATYADGVGPEKYHYILTRNEEGGLDEPNDFVLHAKRAGLLIHPYTFRAENRFLPDAFLKPGQPNGDLLGELQQFLEAGIDGFFIDQPDIGVKARQAYLKQNNN